MTAIDSRARAVVRELKTYKPGTSVKDAKSKKARASYIKLASNENSFGPSPKAVAVLRKGAGDLNRYPDASCKALREALANHLKVETDSLITGNGSDELIVLALRAFVDPGDEVVVASPTFLIYEIQARACGAKVTTVPLKDYRYDLVAMRQAVTPNTKLVFIANPDNPTGTFVTKKELSGFLADLPAQTLVFIDEAYYEFVDAKDYPQSLQMRNDQSLIITRSFSKAYGLAGLRIGYGIAQPDVVNAMNAVREPFNVNSLAQLAAVAALEDSAFLEKTRKGVADGKRYLMKELSALMLRSIPSATNFILIELGPNAAQVAEGLFEHGVIVREMSGWGLSSCIRVTIGTLEENRAFIKALKQCLTQ